MGREGVQYFRTFLTPRVPGTSAFPPGVALLADQDDFDSVLGLVVRVRVPERHGETSDRVTGWTGCPVPRNQLPLQAIPLPAWSLPAHRAAPPSHWRLLHRHWRRMTPGTEPLPIPTCPELDALARETLPGPCLASGRGPCEKNVTNVTNVRRFSNVLGIKKRLR